MDTSTAFEDLRAFRRSLHRCFDRRADALFELGDAMLTAMFSSFMLFVGVFVWIAVS